VAEKSQVVWGLIQKELTSFGWGKKPHKSDNSGQHPRTKKLHLQTSHILCNTNPGETLRTNQSDKQKPTASSQQGPNIERATTAAPSPEETEPPRRRFATPPFSYRKKRPSCKKGEI